MWNGTADTLNANPTASSPIAVTASATEPVRPASASAIADSRVDPDAPYAIAIPNRKKAEENEPSRKYFIAPSIDPSRVEKPVSTYRDSDRISSARNAMIRSRRDREQRHPGGREQQQRVELGLALPRAFEVVVAEHRAHRRDAEDDHAHHDPEAIGRDRLGQHRGAAVPVPEPHGRDGGRGDAHQARAGAASSARSSARPPRRATGPPRRRPGSARA